MTLLYTIDADDSNACLVVAYAPEIQSFSSKTLCLKSLTKWKEHFL